MSGGALRFANAIVALVLGANACVAVAVAAGGAKTLADLRDPFFLRPVQLSDAERHRVLAAAKSGADTTINGVAHGAFTAPGRHETVYVLQRGGPKAADPSAPAGVTLALFDEESFEARLDTDAGNFVQATTDVDGDGVDELLLRADSYQMGEAATRLALVRLSRDRATTIKTFDEARVDRCGDTRFGGDVEAAVIRYEAGSAGAEPVFMVERYSARCVDGEAPRADKFSRTAD